MTASWRGWRLVAGVVVMLLALVVAGRLQGGNLPGGDIDASRAASTTVGTDDTLVASALSVAGRVALPGPAAAVAAGEAPSGCCWSRAVCCGSTPSVTR